MDTQWVLFCWLKETLKIWSLLLVHISPHLVWRRVSSVHVTPTIPQNLQKLYTCSVVKRMRQPEAQGVFKVRAYLNGSLRLRLLTPMTEDAPEKSLVAVVFTCEPGRNIQMGREITSKFWSWDSKSDLISHQQETITRPAHICKHSLRHWGKSHLQPSYPLRNKTIEMIQWVLLTLCETVGTTFSS